MTQKSEFIVWSPWIFKNSILLGSCWYILGRLGEHCLGWGLEAHIIQKYLRRLTSLKGGFIEFRSNNPRRMTICLCLKAWSYSCLQKTLSHAAAEHTAACILQNIRKVSFIANLWTFSLCRTYGCHENDDLIVKRLFWNSLSSSAFKTCLIFLLTAAWKHVLNSFCPSGFGDLHNPSSR